MFKLIKTAGLSLYKTYLRVVLLVLYTSIFSSFASANQDCLDRNKVKLALSEIKLFSEVPSSMSRTTMNPLHSSEIDLCDEDNVVNKTISALIYMHEMDLKSDSNNLFAKEGALGYFKKRVKKIYFEESNEETCKGGTLAYVFQFELDVMHICSRKSEDFESDIKTSSILIHEARHLDGYDHTLCKHRNSIKVDYKKKSSESSGTCDTDFPSQGSYGFQVTYLLDLYSKSENKVEKQIARSDAITELLSHFNTLPLDIKSGKLEVDKNGTATFVDKNDNLKGPYTRTTLFHLGPTIKSVSMLWNNPIFFDETGAVTSYNYSQNLEAAVGPTADYYRINFSNEDYKDLLDIVYKKYWSEYGCFLFTSHLLCMDPWNKDLVVNIPLSKIQPEGFTIVENFASKYDLVYLKDRQGNQYRLPHSFKSLQKTTEESLLYQFKRTVQKSKNPFFNAESGFLLNDSLIESYLPNLLSAHNNRFFTDDDENKISSSPFSIIKETTASEWIVSPFYWSRKLEEL